MEEALPGSAIRFWPFYGNALELRRDLWQNPVLPIRHCIRLGEVARVVLIESDPVLPIFSRLFLCDDIVRDATSGKTHIVGLFDAFRPTESAAPFTLGKLCIFTQVTDWQGPLELRVNIVHAATLDWSFTSPPIRFQVPDRHALVQVPIRLTSIEFSQHGDFLIELYCNGEFIEDRILHVLEPFGG